MKRRKIYYGLVALAWLTLFCASRATANVIEQVLVVLDGEPYTLTNFKEYARNQMNRDFPVGDLNRLGKEDQAVVEQFITDKLLAAEVKQSGIKVSDDDVDQYINQIKEKNQINDEQLREALKREGVAWGKYRASIRSEIEKSEIVDSQVRKRINITSEDVERYYGSNQKKYISDERVRLRHILLTIPENASAAGQKAVMEKAADIRRRTLAGEDFAKLAENYSEGAGASEGGDIGWVARGSLLKEIDELAFGKLAVGEVSQPVRTSAGIHLIRLEAREGGKQLALADVKDKIREELTAKAMDERFQKWLKGDLRRKHKVDVKLPGVVFRPEDTKEGTMDSLVASGSKRTRNQSSSFWDFLNPFKAAPIEDDEEIGRNPNAGQNVISLFGTPLFRSESADDRQTTDEILDPIENPKASAEKPKESGGLWQSLNPFSKK
jgi:peptidyl-prolyl cis-trans isomerase SurA